MPEMGDEMLRVDGLSTRFFTGEGQVNAVEDVSFGVREGEVFGIVGESGSGKSVTGLSVLDLVESPGEVTAGSVWYRNADLAAAVADDHPEAVDGDAVDLRGVPTEVRESLRGTEFSMIFQDPESSFNPSVTVGEQIAEAVEVQRRASATPRSTRARTDDYSLGSLVLSTVLPSKRYVSEESRERAVELLELVGIPDPVERADEYPHEYSGGMLQRAMIAQALAGEPDVLVADEPTTALDVTIQAQILELLRDLQAETGMTILLITHNLGVVARMCDRVGVMYAGEIVERGSLADVFRDNVHPYTQGLLGSVPDLEDVGGALDPIPGNVPSLLAPERAPRCSCAARGPTARAAGLARPPGPAVGADGDTAVGAGSAEATGDERADADAHLVKCVLAETAYGESEPLPPDHFGEGAVDRGGSTAATESASEAVGSTTEDGDGAPTDDAASPDGGERR